MYSMDQLHAVQNQPQDQIINTGLPKESIFNLQTIVKKPYGNVLAFCSGGNSGNVFLYDVSDLTILLVLPNSISLNFTKEERITHSGEKTFLTMHGQKAGYLLYKNNQTHLSKIDSMFPDSNWRDNLLNPLPAVKVTATPVLMQKAVIYHNGENVPASLYEYSDKQLVVFAARDLAGDKNILSPFHKFVCPESPSGYSEGYSAWKNNTRSINFLKQIFKLPDLEAKYVKSIPVRTTQTQIVPKHNHFIIGQKVMYGTNTLSLDVVEISPLAITIFFDPPMGIPGFEENWNNNITNPTNKSKGGFMIPKSRNDMISWFEQTFLLDKFEDRYELTEEESQRATGSVQSSTDNNTNVNTVTNSLSNMSLSSMSDLPVNTLLRLLIDKIKSTEYYNKADIGGKVLIIGSNNQAIADAANLDDMETEIEVIYGDKRAIMLK